MFSRFERREKRPQFNWFEQCRRRFHSEVIMSDDQAIVTLCIDPAFTAQEAICVLESVQKKQKYVLARDRFTFEITSEDEDTASIRISAKNRSSYTPHPRSFLNFVGEELGVCFIDSDTGLEVAQGLPVVLAVQDTEDSYRIIFGEGGVLPQSQELYQQYGFNRDDQFDPKVFKSKMLNTLVNMNSSPLKRFRMLFKTGKELQQISQLHAKYALRVRKHTFFEFCHYLYKMDTRFLLSGSATRAMLPRMLSTLEGMCRSKDAIFILGDAEKPGMSTAGFIFPSLGQVAHADVLQLNTMCAEKTMSIITKLPAFERVQAGRYAGHLSFRCSVRSDILNSMYQSNENFAHAVFTQWDDIMGTNISSIIIADRV